MNNKLLATVFAVLLTAFTVFIALDTFVITRVYQTEVSAADVFSQNEDEDANDSGMAFLNESAENADEAAETNIVSKSVTADTNAETDTGDSSGSSRSGRQGSHRSHHSQTVPKAKVHLKPRRRSALPAPPRKNIRMTTSRSRLPSTK